MTLFVFIYVHVCLCACQPFECGYINMYLEINSSPLEQKHSYPLNYISRPSSIFNYAVNLNTKVLNV